VLYKDVICFQSILKTWIILVNKSMAYWNWESPTPSAYLWHYCTCICGNQRKFWDILRNMIQVQCAQVYAFLLHNWFLLFLVIVSEFRFFFLNSSLHTWTCTWLYGSGTCTCTGTCTMLHLTHLWHISNRNDWRSQVTSWYTVQQMHKNWGTHHEGELIP